jgi:hypothetical protein
VTALLSAPRRTHRYTRRLVDAATFGGAALAAWSAAIHLHLWLHGYRHIPTIGPLFLAQSTIGLAVAAAAVAIRRGVTAVAGAAYLAATSVGLLVSATVGLFNFHDGLDAPYAGLSLTIQLVGMVLFGLAAVASARGRDRRRRLTRLRRHPREARPPGAKSCGENTGQQADESPAVAGLPANRARTTATGSPPLYRVLGRPTGIESVGNSSENARVGR